MPEPLILYEVVFYTLNYHNNGLNNPEFRNSPLCSITLLCSWFICPCLQASFAVSCVDCCRHSSFLLYLRCCWQPSSLCTICLGSPPAHLLSISVAPRPLRVYLCLQPSSLLLAYLCSFTGCLFWKWYGKLDSLLSVFPVSAVALRIYPLQIQGDNCTACNSKTPFLAILFFKDV